MKNCLSLHVGSVIVVLATLPHTLMAAEKDPISDYQANLSAGAVSAAEMLGLAASAVSTLQSPKDFVAAINSLNSGDAKAGFGLSLTPARTPFAPVSVGDYRNNLGSRAWAGTSFSYAQNTSTRGGVDYKQEAVALHVAFFINKEDDPVIAGHEAFQKCTPLLKLADDRTSRLLALKSLVRAELKEKAAGKEVDEEVVAQQALQRLALEEKAKSFAAKAAPLYKACVDDAIGEAKAKWNASQFALTIGEGRIRNPAAGSSNLSLGRQASLTLALGPNVDSLVNITLRRTSKSLDLATIATTPAYKSSSLVGARWTYRAMDTKDLYAIAEVSNAKGTTTVNNSVFKYAFGVDKRLSESMWLELRMGRNHTQDGKTEQTTALASVKFSPETSLGR